MARIKGNRACQDCEFYRHAGNVCIMGSGPIPSDIMVVLDQPGWTEDNTGRPLSGNMHTFLKDLLSRAGIDMRKCFITNAVKCRAPEKAKVKNINACRKYLEKEIKAVKPKYILLMGATALTSQKNQMGISKVKITELHGQPVEVDGVIYYPTFSPGIAFRDPQKLTLLETDLKRFSQITKGKKPHKVELNYHIVETFEDFNGLIDDCQNTEIASFDIETTSLNRFEGKITLLGIGLPEKQWILPLNIQWSRFNGQKEIQTEMIELISEALKGKKVVTHNGKFDNLWLRTHYGVRIHNTFDTMIAAYILDENTPNGLKYLARTRLGVPDWDIDKDTKTGKIPTNRNRLCKYLAYDLYYTLALYDDLKKDLKKDKSLLKVFKYLLMPVFHTYENVQFEGVWIYKERFESVREQLLKDLKEVQNQLIEHCRKAGVKNPEQINFGSAKQLGKLLFEDLKLPIVERTNTGNPSTGEATMLALVDKHPIIEDLIKFKEIRQQISFFIDGWKKRMVGNKLYPNFNIHVVVTGRTSSNDPNLQQVPRDKKIRSLIGAPPGWVMVEADYSQVELRVVAELSKDPTMRVIFQTGEDIHQRTASQTTGKPEDQITKEERKSAKAVNFGFVYGMGWRKFKDYAFQKYGVKLTDQQAQEFRKRFFELYNTLPDWHEKQRRLARAYKRVRNPIGRIRRLPEIDSPDKGKVAEAERQAINSPVQSFASDLMLMSLIEIDRKAPKDKLRIIGSVHDAGLFIVKREHINEMLPLIKKTMQNPSLLKKFGVTLSVPLIADVEIGDWGNGVEWNGEFVSFDKDGNVVLSKDAS